MFKCRDNLILQAFCSDFGSSEIHVFSLLESMYINDFLRSYKSICGWGYKNMVLEPKSAKSPNLHSTPVNHGRVFGIPYEWDLHSSITIIFPERLKPLSYSKAFLAKKSMKKSISKQYMQRFPAWFVPLKTRCFYSRQRIIHQITPKSKLLQWAFGNLEN